MRRFAVAAALLVLVLAVSATASVLSTGRLSWEATMMPQFRWDTHGSGQIHIQTNCDSATGDRIYLAVSREFGRQPEVMVHAMSVVPRGCTEVAVVPVAVSAVPEAVVDGVEDEIGPSPTRDRVRYVRRLPEPRWR